MESNQSLMFKDTTCSEIFQMYQNDDMLSEETFILASIAACGEEHSFAEFGIKDRYIRFTLWKQIYQQITSVQVVAQAQLIPDNTNIDDFRRFLQQAGVFLSEDQLVGIFQLLDRDCDGSINGDDVMPYIR